MEEAAKKFGRGAEITLISLGTGLRNLLSPDQRENPAVEIGERDVEDLAQKIQGGGSCNPSLAKQLARQLVLIATETEITHSQMPERFE